MWDTCAWREEYAPLPGYFRSSCKQLYTEQMTAVTESDKNNEPTATDVTLMSLETVTLSQITLNLDQKRTTKSVL